MVRKIRFKEVSKEMQSVVMADRDEKKRISIGFENNIGEYYYLSLENLLPYHKQARKTFNQEEIDALASSIKQFGVRQPLSVVKSNITDGKFEVISGERRLRAAKLVGLEKVPCIIIADQDNSEEVALIENIHRSDLHPIELADAYSSLLLHYNHGDQQRLADKIGVSKSSISEKLKLALLPDIIKKTILDHNIRSRNKLRAIANAKTKEEMSSIIDGLVENNKNNRKKSKIIELYHDGINFHTDMNKNIEKHIVIDLCKELRKIILALEKC